MPPADNNTPAPTPAPEQPKKQGFFAKLFGGGKKTDSPAVPENHESQTPPPQLDDSSEATPNTDPIVPVAAEPTIGVQPGTPSGSDTTTPTLDVPPSLATPSEDVPPLTPPAEPSVPSTGFDSAAPAQSAEEANEESTPPTPPTPPSVPPIGPVTPAQ